VFYLSYFNAYLHHHAFNKQHFDKALGGFVPKRLLI